jgi:hypothetical protein
VQGRPAQAEAATYSSDVFWILLDSEIEYPCMFRAIQHHAEYVRISQVSQRACVVAAQRPISYRRHLRFAHVRMTPLIPTFVALRAPLPSEHLPSKAFWMNAQLGDTRLRAKNFLPQMSPHYQDDPLRDLQADRHAARSNGHLASLLHAEKVHGKVDQSSRHMQ